MKKIPLSQGKFALVDDEDFNELNKYKWCASFAYGIWYVQRDKFINSKRKKILMHRQLMNFPPSKMVDHINHDGLDNRRCNLRVCTRSQNKKNCLGYKNNTSGLNGVYWNKENKKWQARIRKDNKLLYLGYFDDKVEAGHMVDQYAMQLFGEFAVLNFD
jgi:hypothetical protein